MTALHERGAERRYLAEINDHCRISVDTWLKRHAGDIHIVHRCHADLKNERSGRRQEQPGDSTKARGCLFALDRATFLAASRLQVHLSPLLLFAFGGRGRTGAAGAAGERPFVLEYFHAAKREAQPLSRSAFCVFLSM